MYFPTKLAPIICAACLLATSATAQLIAVTLPATQDNTLYESTTGALSNGVGPNGFVGGDSSANRRRYLIQFDIAGSIPAEAHIYEATLRLFCTDFPAGVFPDTYGTHRVLVPWGEGTSSGGEQGAPATPGDATWLHSSFPATDWSSPGGDAKSVASVYFTIGTIGLAAAASPTLTTEIQDMLDNPSTNFGWMIRGVSEVADTQRELGSRESLMSFNRPSLRIRYYLPTSYPFCDPGNNNSTGGPAVLSGHFGSGIGSGLHLDVSGGPLPLADGSRMMGYMLVGSAALAGQPLSDGQFCLAGSPGYWARYNVFGTNQSSIGLFDAAGDYQNMVGTGGPSGYGFDVPSELNVPASPPLIVAGSTYHFQFWYRDTLAGTGHSNFSNGLSALF